jgi:hypothetical protein
VCLIALGRPRYHFFANVGRFVAVWSAIPIGWRVSGLDGVLWGTTISELPMLVVFWTAFRRLGHLRLAREAIAPVSAGVGALIGFGIKLALSTYFPDLHLHPR